MPLLRNKPLADCLDFEASIRHYQDLNHQIEQQTTAVFDMVNKLNNSKNSENSQYAEKSKTEVLDQFKESNKNTSSDATVALTRATTRDKPAVNKHQIIVDLNQRLRDLQNELESTKLQQKKSEEERELQRQELIYLKENVKKMKSALHSKQLLYDANKKEVALAMEKLKSEEQARKSLQKEIERIAKQLILVTADKEKLAEKLEHSKTDLMLLKQHKIDDHPVNKVPIMLKCIRKQSLLIDNLLRQISCLEQSKNLL
ncbi:polyamine-modulated factor 1-binding protein 1-like [Daphnia carinata]|uniref:polyamine-modulated factor 1-binding protein 1-like n=1 Tax=Daphnia carinata TaxID=120202 RepID=UPI00257C2485|nr:polyamine-modulated factor 1-binding protein 1-like [Daphnia carinata]